MAFRGFIPLAVSLEEGDGGASASISVHHIFYKKQHANKKNKKKGKKARKNDPKAWGDEDQEEEEEDASDRTLFAANIPPTFDYAAVSAVFACFGAVDAVLFQKGAAAAAAPALPPGVLTSRRPTQEGSLQARVVFAEQEAVETALASAAQMRNTRQPCPLGDGGDGGNAGSGAAGTAKWLARYHAVRPKSDTLQQQVDRFMEAFDQRTASEKAARHGGPTVDEDGWTVVRTSGKRRRLLLPKGVEEGGIGGKKKKKKGPELNFYKHQQIQKKRDALADLRRKFEEDKRRLAQQTGARKFKPF